MHPCFFNKEAWYHIPMAFFLPFTLGGYGMCLHFNYLKVNPWYHLKKNYINEALPYDCEVSQRSCNKGPSFLSQSPLVLDAFSFM